MKDSSLTNTSTCCAKIPVRQINILYRFRGGFDINEEKNIHNTIIFTNINFCPIVQQFCDSFQKEL